MSDCSSLIVSSMTSTECWDAKDSVISILDKCALACTKCICCDKSLYANEFHLSKRGGGAMVFQKGLKNVEMLPFSKYMGLGYVVYRLRSPKS